MPNITDGPSFDVSKVDAALLHEISLRAKRLGHRGPALTLEMDLTACHANGCPLDLQKLLCAPDFDFMHDVVGIQRHIYRPTGKLEDYFLPRCAMPSTNSELEDER